MTAHDVEEIGESTDHAMDTIEVEQTNNPRRMPVRTFMRLLDELTIDTLAIDELPIDESRIDWPDIDEPDIDEPDIDEPDIDEFFSELPWSAYQPPTESNFTQAKAGALDDHDALSSSPGYQQSLMSDFNSSATFVTASSLATFTSARSTYNGPAMRVETIREDEPPEPGLSAPLRQLHGDYYSSLHKREIIQPFDKELNWSGKGQHVTFSATDAIPLSHMSHLGSSMSASVDKVLCRRVALARKTMRCDRRWTVADALQEVYHLQNLRHYHIVQLVGTYLQGRNFSILMYPAADTHLGRFLEDTLDMDIWVSMRQRVFLSTTLACLASAVAFIHQHTTKHMDIKPQNILVREVYSSDTWHKWRVYIADFGLSRSFASQDHSQTDGPTSRTPKYCAPEVYNYEQRGRSADVFSLGCVFLEILTAICCIDLQVFADARRGDGDDESFHANLDRTVEWARRNLCASSSDLKNPSCVAVNDNQLAYTTELVISMVAQEPEKRPTAAEIRNCLKSEHVSTLNLAEVISKPNVLFRSGPRVFSQMSCCDNPQEPYEAYQTPVVMCMSDGLNLWRMLPI